jgi:protocatechuate 3,4-dioxygenase beta subunit
MEPEESSDAPPDSAEPEAGKEPEPEPGKQPEAPHGQEPAPAPAKKRREGRAFTEIFVEPMILVVLAGLAAATLFPILVRYCAVSHAPNDDVRVAPDALADAGEVARDVPPTSAVTGRVVVPTGSDSRTARVRIVGAEGETVAEATPDADGRFELAAPADWDGGLVASCSGLPSVVVHVPTTGTPPPLEIRLVAGASLLVRVVDDEGKPVQGALVAPDVQDQTWSEGERRAVARLDAVRTGADGTASLPTAATGTLEIVVEAEGMVAARPDPIELPASAPLDVELDRGGRLTGEVVDARGASRPGAHVRIVGSGLWPAKEYPVGPDGTFDAGLLPPGFYEAEAFDQEQVSPLKRGIELRPSETTTIQLALAPGGFVAGRVNLEGGAPPPADGLLVTLHGLQARLVPLRVEPAADGTFRAGPLQPGRYLARCAVSPFLPAEAWTEVAAEADAQVALVLRPGRTLEGRVVGPDGAPVAGARLSLSGRAVDGGFIFRSPTTEALAALDRRGIAPVGRLLPIGELGVLEGPLPPIPPRPFGWLDSPPVIPERNGSSAPIAPPGPEPLTSDARGAFSIPGLPPGSYTVSVSHRDFAPLAQDVVVPDVPPTTSVVLQMTEGCTLAGLVRDDAGNPVAGAGVRVSAGTMEPLVWQTDEAGAFVAPHLPPHVMLHIQAAGFLTSDLEQDMAGTPCAGQTEISLVKLGGRISGRVLDGRRFPIAGVRVKAEPPEGRVRWATQGTVSGADGTFRLSAPSKGEVRLVAGHPDWVSASIVAEVGEGVEIVLSRGVIVRGKVTDEVGEPLAASIVLRADGREVASAVAAPDGAFTAGRVAPGSYQLRASAAGFADQTILLGIEEPPEGSAEQTRSVELTLRRGVTLEGRVVDRFDDPVAGAALEARHRSGEGESRAGRSDADGRFRFDGLEPGTWQVEATREDLGTMSAEATLDVGTRSRPLEIEFRDRAAAPGEPGAPTAPEAASGRIGYSLINDAVIVRVPVTAPVPGSDVLLAGDVIFQVERERIRDLETFRGILARVHRATISVAILRDGRRKFLTVAREMLLADGWE